MMKDRTCKRCARPLGSQAHKCPQCGQLNPTVPYWIALGLGMFVVGIFVVAVIAVLV